MQIFTLKFLSLSLYLCFGNVGFFSRLLSSSTLFPNSVSLYQITLPTCTFDALFFSTFRFTNDKDITIIYTRAIYSHWLVLHIPGTRASGRGYLSLLVTLLPRETRVQKDGTRRRLQLLKGRSRRDVNSTSTPFVHRSTASAHLNRKTTHARLLYGPVTSRPSTIAIGERSIKRPIATPKKFKRYICTTVPSNHPPAHYYISRASS